MASVKTSPPKTQTRMAAEDRRQQIIDVAIQLFSQKGFSGTTTKEIARLAGINEAIIFRHFATKEELYTAIIDYKSCANDFEGIEAGIEKAMAERNDRKLFETMAFHILEVHRKDETFMRLLFYSALEGHELADIFYRNQVTVKHRLLAGYIKQRIAEGAFRKIDPLTAVRTFAGTVLYHALTSRFFNQSLGDQKIDISNRTIAERFVDIFLAGIANPEIKATKRS